MRETKLAICVNETLSQMPLASLSLLGGAQVQSNKPDYYLSTEISVLASDPSPHYLEQIKSHSAAIERVWRDESLKRPLFNGQILGIEGLQQHSGLELVIYPVEYKHYLAQRAGIDLGVMLLAVSGLVFYRSGGERIFFVGQRAQDVTQDPGFYEFIPSGSIEVASSYSKSVPYRDQLFLELKEELGIEKIKSCREFCLIPDELNRVWDIGFEVEVDRQNILNLNEYDSLELVSESQLKVLWQQTNVVKTSRTLFAAWQAFLAGSV